MRLARRTMPKGQKMPLLRRNLAISGVALPAPGTSSSAAGGPRRVWHLDAASQELADPKFGLFKSYDGGRTLHPSPVSSDAQPDHLAHFELCGRLAGLALLPLGFVLLF